MKPYGSTRSILHAFLDAYVFGNISAASLSNTYYPKAARGADLLLTNVAVGLAGRAAANLIQEFAGKRLTKNVPTAQVSR